jgi:hypothetical protein
MGLKPANESKGPSLPPSRFASTHFRAPATPAALRRLCACLAFALPLAIHAQQALGDSRAAARRARAFLAQRSSANHLSPATSLARARAQHIALQQQEQAHPHTANLTVRWQPLGPNTILSPTYNNLTGRITAIALDPNDATGNTVYLGATGGGVWKSTNAAGPLANVTFNPLTDTLPVFSANAGTGILPSLSIGAVAVQPSIDPIVLAGTGDPNDATDSYYGEGILRSADGGVTWTLVQGSTDGANGNHSFIGLATAGFAFASPSLVVAAFSVSPQSAVVDAATTSSIPGLYYSADAGLTWHMASIYDGSQVVQQPQPPGTGEAGNPATSVVWDPLRQQFFAAVRSHGYYASPDGITWTRLLNQPGTALTIANCPFGSNGLGSANCPIFRGALAAQPVTGDLYALTVDADDLDQGLWQDLCNATSNVCATPQPAFANRIDNAALEVGGGSTEILQGSYDLALTAAPAASNATLLFAATVDLYSCQLAQGATTCIPFRNTTNALNGCLTPAQVAPAEHTLAAVAQTLFLGTDGGLWRSLDGVAETGPACSATDHTHFDNLNPGLGTGGSLAEVVGFAQDPSATNTLLAGLGAIGSAATSTASTFTAWPQLSAGEGGLPSIDPTDSMNWYASIGTEINVVACALGSDCTAADFNPPATVGEPQVRYDAALLDAPTLLDPAQTTNLLAATCRVWRGPASDNPAWTAANALSPAFDNSATPCSETSPLIRSLAAGGPTYTSANLENAGSGVLYAGLAGTLDGGGRLPGHLFVTTTANLSTPTWLDAALSPVTNDTANAGLFNPANFDIASIAVDPHDSTGATVYATVMGFGGPHLYASTDFGAHWLNLSANLPDAPANAVVVDPYDANTVYIALDTGVYVTQDITTCPTTNCWSVLGTALPNSPIVALAAGAKLPIGDGRQGLLRAATYGRGLWQTPLLTAIPIAQPAITLSATSFTFPPQQVDTQSAAQTLTLTSSGNAPVTLNAFTITGDFAETDDCAGQTLAVNSTCTVQIVFAPTATGLRSGQLTINGNFIAGNGQANVLLSGTGTTPASIILTPAALTFAATIVGQTTAAQTITVSNTGGTTATLQTPVLTGETTDFNLTANTCTTTLAPNAQCVLSIDFTPTTDGPRAATLSLTDNVGTQTAALSGTGQFPATDTLTPLTLSFPQQTINTTSPAQTITLSNTGDLALTSIAPSLTPGDFAFTTTCTTTLPAKSSCTFSVTFTPTATGTRSSTLTITDALHSQAFLLSGIGITPASIVLTPTSLTFATTIVNQTTAAQNITISNTGDNPATLQTPIIAGESTDFALSANTCGVTLPSQTGCTVSITFTPTAAGARSATLSITDNVGTQSATLIGTGNAPATDTLAPTALTFAQQTIGTTSPAQQVTLTNTGGVALTLISASVSPGDFAVTNSCGNSLAANSTCAFSVSFAPTASGARSATLTISDQFRSQTVALSGIGIAPPGISLSPASLTFAATGVGLTTQPQTLTLTNNGGLPLTISSIAASTGFTIASNACTTTLAANAACAITMVFAPTTAGRLSGALTLTDNAPSATQAALLSGMGIDFTLAPNGPTSATVAATAASATYPLLLSSLSGLSGAVPINCSGAPKNSTCTVVPAIAQLGGTSTISVTVETGVAPAPSSAAKPQTLAANSRPFTILLALLLPLALCLRSRRRRTYLASLAILFTLFTNLTGCGADRIIPNSTTIATTTPTPAGTYTLTVSASAAGLTHSVTLTLIVQ